ncbi:MAG: serine/threonine protein kinase [Deltaproteobacteria bacterium]|nr:serine/threonine protein kinase [Deltaproteobacteria bacterium]MBK8714591.1 serine/threonine protein kinase [Deltaproteobacteria bacterium]MBP7290026.1 serine/threonine protein kinase [Nannocystaceae bacterium]
MADPHQDPTDRPPGALTATMAVPVGELGETGPMASRPHRAALPHDLAAPTLPYGGDPDPLQKPPPAASLGDDGGGDTLISDRDLALERQEHAAAVARMRRLMPIACVLWLGFGFVDWVLATFIAPAPLASYLVLRLFGLVPLVGCMLWLRLAPAPGPTGLRVLDGVMTASVSAVLTDMCLLSGGLTSPYAAYIALVLVGRAAVLPNHWRIGAVQLAVPVLVHPLVFLASAPFSPELAAQLHDGHAIAVSFFYLMLLFGAWALLVIGGHNVWALRRQLFRSRSIGRYRLERRIGRGGMGEVWIAFHEQLRRDVALKILRPEYGTDPIAVQRFEREVMTTAALTHPNTVRIYDHGTTDDGLWYYAMELLEGDDLSSIVRRHGPLTPARAIHLALQAARALGEAHAAGIVHRDIKPENLFVARLGGESDVVKLLDFGIARTASVRDSRLTTTGWVAGTPAYLSPEAAKGEPAGAPADVYGVGMALFWALTGTVPFGGDSPIEVLARQVNDPVPSPSLRRGEALPPELEALVLRTLAKDPQQRFEDGTALAQALQELARMLPWRPHHATVRAPALAPQAPAPRS